MSELFIRCKDLDNHLVMVPLSRVREICLKKEGIDDLVYTVDSGVCFAVVTDSGNGYWAHALVDAREEMKKGVHEVYER